MPRKKAVETTAESTPAPVKKAAAPRKPKPTGMAGGKLETFKAGDPASVEKFKEALYTGKVGSMGHSGGQWEFLK